MVGQYQLGLQKRKQKRGDDDQRYWRKEFSRKPWYEQDGMKATVDVVLRT